MTADLSGKHFFIVDDTSFMRLSLVKVLGEMGILKSKITEFENGRLALDALKSGEYKCDIILCDWNMPRLTGIDLLKEIRAMKGDIGRLPFVLITTESEKGKVVEAIQYSVNGYILKPINLDKIKTTLTQIFDEDSEDE